VAAYLLDTNHLSPLVTSGHLLRKRVLRQHAQGDQFSIAVPALTEFLFGLHLTPRATANFLEWEQLQDQFGYYTISVAEARDAAAMQASLRRAGRQLTTVDALIAIVAIRNSLILLTTDGDFRAIPQLMQENWLK
jgi:tRNA(fMet)-specific endonuclease VapC